MQSMTERQKLGQCNGRKREGKLAPEFLYSEELVGYIYNGDHLVTSTSKFSHAGRSTTGLMRHFLGVPPLDF